MGRVISFHQAVNEAMHIALQSDPDVILMGEDVAGGGGREDQGIEEAWGGVMGVTKGLYKAFGPERVIDTPISEMGFMGIAVGAAATGLRPIVELMFMDFIGVAFDPLLNQASKLRYMFGGKARVPLVVRTMSGAGLRAAAQHSQSLYGMTSAIPGLKTLCPATPYDAKGMLLAAVRDDDPVVFCEAKTLYGKTGEVPEEDYEVELGRARIHREGSDLTLVGVGATVYTALDAAAALEQDGISTEVVDLRSLSPLDEETILSSLEKTGRLVVIDEATPRCGVASEIQALCVDRGFDHLDAPVRKVTAPHTPVPFAPILEDAYLPSVKRTLEVVAELL